jgi:hypothetical protein
LQGQLQESAAYRSYFARADARLLLELDLAHPEQQAPST